MAPITNIHMLLNSKLEIKIRQASASTSFFTTAVTQTTATSTVTSPTPAPTIYNLAPSLAPNNGGPIIGGVVGGFVGTLLLIFLIWKGCWEPSLAYPYNRSSRYGSDDEDDSSTSLRSNRVRRRGGGGDGFRMHSQDRRGAGIKKPPRVHSRRERAWKVSYSDGRRRSGPSERGSKSSRVFEWRAGGFGRPRYVTRSDIRRWSKGEKRRDGDLRFNVRDD